MQVCTSPQTDNHASTPPLSFLQAGCPSCRPTNSAKALKAKINNTAFYTILISNMEHNILSDTHTWDVIKVVRIKERFDISLKQLRGPYIIFFYLFLLKTIYSVNDVISEHYCAIRPSSCQSIYQQIDWLIDWCNSYAFVVKQARVMGVLRNAFCYM